MDPTFGSPFLDSILDAIFVINYLINYLIWESAVKWLLEGPRADLGLWPSRVSKQNFLGATILGSPQNQGPHFKPKFWTPFWTPFLHPILESVVKWPPEGPRAALGPRRSKVSCHLPRKQGCGAARPPLGEVGRTFTNHPPLPTHPPPH